MLSEMDMENYTHKAISKQMIDLFEFIDAENKKQKREKKIENKSKFLKNNHRDENEIDEDEKKNGLLNVINLTKKKKDNILRKHKFSITSKPSTIPNAGEGLFLSVDNDDVKNRYVPPGTLVAIYPGI